MLRLPALIFSSVFILLITLTQFLAYQQYKISKETERAELEHEATEAKDRFRNILFNDIAAANTLAIIYKQYGVLANFDSVARQIIQASTYAEALQITENGIVRNVYPDVHYKSTIGTNVNADPVRKAEEASAIERREIYFAGPRALKFGDTGILGKVPIIVGDKVVAVATVLTRLQAIKDVFTSQSAAKKKFSYQLLKTQVQDTSFFLLSDSRPVMKSEYVDMAIPEGDWLLRVSYGDGPVAEKFLLELSGLGLLFSFLIALLAYREAHEPYRLKKIINEKTEQLSKSEKYFRTLIETSSDAIVLLDANGQVLYQSPSTEKILGYTLPEVQQMDGLQLIHPDDRTKNNTIFYKEISVPGATVQCNHRVKHKNGNYIHIEGTYRNLLNDEHIKAIVYSYKDVTEKVWSKQILIESENRFRRAFEDSAIGMGLVSIQEYSMGKWLKVNRSLCDMLGYTEDELLSRTFMEITHPEDLAESLTAQDQILQRKLDTCRLEKRYLHKDGSFVWINLNVSIVRDKEKKPLYLVAQIENMTEKIESKNKFQKLVESFGVGVYIFQDNKIVYINPRVIEETGYTEEEIINMPHARFIYPEDLEPVNDIIYDRTKRDTTARCEVRILGKVGEPIWYEILGSSILYKGAPALIGTMVNITQRKAMYDDLVRSDANLRSIFDTTNICYLLLDINYNIMAFNQQMSNVYMDVAGFELKEGHNLIELMLPEKREAAKAVYDRTVQTNRSEDYETSYEKEGACKHFLANVKPIYDGTKVIGICISAIDITERKKMTQDLINHVNAIEKQNTKLREISWIQSHVIRAPLSKIMGLIDLFTNQEGKDIDEQMILKYILISANELDEIVKNISDKVYDNNDDPDEILR